MLTVRRFLGRGNESCELFSDRVIIYSRWYSDPRRDIATRVSRLFNLMDIRLPDIQFGWSSKKEQARVQVKEVLLHQFHQRNQGIGLWVSKKKSAFISRNVVFNEDSILQAKSKMEDKTQCKASDSSTISTERSLSFQMTPTLGFCLVFKRRWWSKKIQLCWRDNGLKQKK